MDIKKIIMSDREKSKDYPLNLIEKLNSFMEFDKFQDDIDKEIEGATLSLFTQIVKEENEYKKVVARIFIKTVMTRIKKMLEFKALRNKQEFERERGLLKDVKESEKINENIELEDKNEKKILFLLGILSKNGEPLIIN